jgi:uncharacterized protein YcfJ
MKKTILLAVLGTAVGLCAAQEVGRVISSTPVISQVGVPRQVCTNSQVQVQGQKSGGGALMGAIAGGAIGNSVGGGDGRAVATVLGLMGGALMGDRLEGGGQPQTQTVQNCTTQTFYENRTTAYNVVYEFAGKQYSVQMPQDPGPTVRLQVTPVGAQAAPAAALSESGQGVAPQQVYTQPVYTQPVYSAPVVVAAAPVVYAAPYPVYYGQPFYPPIGVSLNLGWRGGGGGGHRHWR